MRERRDSKNFEYRPNRIKKVSVDMFTTQGGWTLWYLGIFLSINLALHFFIGHLAGGERNFLNLSLDSARVYMLIIGIISGAAMTGMFVKLGVSRREFYFGNLLATLLLAGGLFILSVFLHGFISLILPGYLFLEGVEASKLLEDLLMVLYFYFAGWLIALGFKRFSVVPGIMIILFLSGVMGVIQSLWNNTEQAGVFNIFLWVVNLEILNVSTAMAAVLTMVILGITLGAIYKLIERVSIDV